ncbi:MAG: hypothetical protein WCO55_02065 [Candidatus Falkowbacteria bacterium]
MQNKHLAWLAALAATGLIAAGTSAQYGPPPGTQMGPPSGSQYGPPSGSQMGPPSQEEIQKMIEQGQQQAQQQAQQNAGPSAGTQLGTGQGYTMQAGADGKVFCQYTDANPTPEVMNACQSAIAQSQAALDAAKGQLPQGAPSAEDVQKMMQGGEVPAGMQGKIPPEALAKAKEQISAALEKINEGLTQAEDQTKDLADGQVPGADKQTASIKKAREIYNQAKAAMDAGNVQEAGKLLGAMPKPPTPEELDKLGITSDLINDIRKKMKDALAQTSQIDDPASQTEAQAQINAALAQLDKADSSLKAGDKKGAMAIMAELRKSAPDASAMDAGNMMDRIPASKLGPIIDRIGQELAAGEKGMAQAAAKGVAISDEAKANFAKAQDYYKQAKDLFDAGKIKESAAKLKELKDLKLQEYFAAFKEQVMPKSRQQSLLQEGKNGVKALELTIKQAQIYGMDTAELTALLGQLKPIIDQAEAAFNAGNLDQFMQYMTMADQLHTGDAVDKIIRGTANERAKNLITASLAQLEPGLKDLSSLINSLKAAGKSTTQAEAVLKQAQDQVAKARSQYNAGKYIEAGQELDGVTESMISLANIAKDSGLALSASEKAALDKALTSGQKPDLSLVSADKQKQITDMMKSASPQDRQDLNNSMLNFDPALFDQIAASRQSDKQFIDNVMADVMPLLSPEEQAKFMEGKTGLLAESQGADKTIAVIKKISGVSTDTFKSLAFIKDQIKSYNFQPDTAAELQAKVADFNNKVQAGDLKDPTLIKAYAQTLETEIKTAETQDNTAKFKDGTIPAKNIDNNNPAYADVKYLVDDGALKADAKGNIDLSKKMTKQDLGKMLQNAQDAGNVNLGSGSLTLKDALTLTANTYGVGGAPADLAVKLELSGKPNLNAPLTQGQAAEIVAAADQRWGGGVQK